MKGAILLRNITTLVMVSAGLIYGPSVTSATPNASDAVSRQDSNPSRALVKFEYPLDLKSAIEAAKGLDARVIGFRFDNGPLIGEYYPTVKHSPAHFLDTFKHDYGTSPRIVAAIAEFKTQEDAAREVVIPTKIRGNKISAAAPDGSLLGARLSALVDQADNSTFHDIDEPVTARLSGDEWRADTVGAAVTRSNSTPDTIQFEQAAKWTYASPVNIPTHFGIEFSTELYNDLPTTAQWPLCDAGAADQFAALVPVVSWTIYSPGNPSGLSVSEPWFDSNIEDSCNRQTFTVGLRYPIALNPTIDDEHLVYVQIVADEGSWETNRISANHQLVDDFECLRTVVYWLPFCMGFWQQVPPDVPSERMVLSGDRNWHAPDRCWRSAYYGLDPASPLMTCGQAARTNFVSVDSLVADPVRVSDGDYYGWNVTFEHDAGAAINPALSPYLLGLPSLSSDGPPHNTTPSVVTDLRMWIEGIEVPVVQHEGWEFDYDLVTGTVSLEAPTLGLSRGGMHALLEDGWISFRMGRYGDVNALRLEGLGHYLLPEANVYDDYAGTPGAPAPSIWYSGDLVEDRSWLDVFRDEPFTIHYTTWYDTWASQLRVDRVWATQVFSVEDLTLTTSDLQVLPGLNPACADLPVCPDTGTNLSVMWELDYDEGIVWDWDLVGPFPTPVTLEYPQTWEIEERVFKFPDLDLDGVVDSYLPLGGKLTFTPTGEDEVSLVTVMNRLT